MNLLELDESPVADVEVIGENSADNFMAANTRLTSYNKLKDSCIIPVFSKDNESTISHPEFISTVQEAAREAFSGQSIRNPCIRVSHPVKGRIPEAMGKPAKQLLDNEKTIYYERMGFIMDIPSMIEEVGDNRLNLSVGGVRAYNLENLYNRKSEERFKVFVGFQNQVCTNLCIFTDGYVGDLKVRTLSELKDQVKNLFAGFNADRQLSIMNSLPEYSISEEEFARLVGKARMYQYLPSKVKKEIPAIHLGDSQVSTVVRDYYRDESFSRDENGNINLWKLYNLFTGAAKSSYLDTFLDRNVGSSGFITRMMESIRTKQVFWYLN